jgi:signal transduction histidine kinase
MVNSQIKYHCEVKAVYGTLPKITANNGKLCQVFTNLLVNAGHAIEGKGTIYIHTKDLGDNIEVSIMDTGKGIKNEHKSHLFEPFFTTKEPGKGTGLGLSISYGIVQEHGGDIQVHSQVGKGTKFTLTLPVFVP